MVSVAAAGVSERVLTAATPVTEPAFLAGVGDVVGGAGLARDVLGEGAGEVSMGTNEGILSARGVSRSSLIACV